jgi:flavodoxin
MKTLVVFYSRDGSTRKVAEELRGLLGADVEEITEPKGRGGPVGWLRSGQEAMKSAIVPINPVKVDPSAYDVVVIGTPIWAWNVASPVRSYMVETKAKLPKVAFFCCMDSKPGETFSVMETLAGKAPVAKAEFMSKEVKEGAFKEKTKTFVEEIKRNVAS